MWCPGSSQLDRIEAMLARQTRLLLVILEKENIIMAIEDDLEAKVAALTTVEQSAVTLMNGIGDRVQQAVDAFKAANPGVDVSRLQASVTAIGADTDALAAAVAANTPAAPAPAAPQPGA